MSKDVTDVVKSKGGCHVFLKLKRCWNGHEQNKTKRKIIIGNSSHPHFTRNQKNCEKRGKETERNQFIPLFENLCYLCKTKCSPFFICRELL